ncbi:hypothetical protein SCUP234_13274 [Seiridium cupressi]
MYALFLAVVAAVNIGQTKAKPCSKRPDVVYKTLSTSSSAACPTFTYPAGIPDSVPITSLCHCLDTTTTVTTPTSDPSLGRQKTDNDRTLSSNQTTQLGDVIVTATIMVTATDETTVTVTTVPTASSTEITTVTPTTSTAAATSYTATNIMCFTTGGIQSNTFLQKRGNATRYSPRNSNSNAQSDYCPVLPNSRPSSEALSSVCSCLGFVPTSTTTVGTARQTWTTTIAASNITTTLTSTSTLLITATTTQTSITTEFTTLTETAPTPVVTSTTTIIDSNVVPTGLTYHYASGFTFRSGTDDYANTREIVNSLSNNPGAFKNTGSIQVLNDLISDNGASMKLPDNSYVDGDSFAMIFQGYIYAAAGPGNYVLSSRLGYLDDDALVWVGEKAYGNNWNYDNSDYRVTWGTGGYTEFILAAGEAKPVTVFWTNTGGPGHADFVITGPDGLHTDTSAFFVSDCGGNFIA